MPARLTILTGPARSGKTERLLDRYRRALAESPAFGALWITPTYRACQRILERLLDGGLTGCFGPGVLTFDRFAQRVLDCSGRRIRPLTAGARRSLVHWLLARENAAGRLSWFGRIAQTSGLVDMICEFLAELKRLEIWPDDFERGCRSRGKRRRGDFDQKDRELCSLYAGYQDLLLAHDLYDAEGRFWTARDLLTKGQRRPLENLRLVVVDGFADFTRTQFEILEELARRAGELYVSLPLERGLRQADLFAKCQETLQRLEQFAQGGVEVVVERTQRAPTPTWPAMRHLGANLFLPPADVERSQDTAGVEIIAAAQERGEVEQLARRIKRLLTKGEDAAAGDLVKPGEIAVVVRSLSSYATLIRETFDEYGIPTAIETGRRLSESPQAAVLLLLLRLCVQDWPYRLLLALLGHNLFRPKWRDVQRSVDQAQQLVRVLQVPGGRQALLDAARTRGEATEESTAEESFSQRSDVAGLAFLERLDRSLATLPAAATPCEWAGVLEALRLELGLVTDDEPLELVAWETIVEGLFRGEQLFLDIDQPPPRISAAELLRLLEDHCSHQRLPREADDAGRVRVLSAASIRALDVLYLFFAGLSERSFPALESAGRAYDETGLDRLREAGLPLPSPAQRGHDEMLLFYEVLTRATRRLWLSYPALDQRAEPLLPSPYLREIEALFAAGSIRKSAATDLSPLPPADQPALSPRDLRLLGVVKALQGEAQLLTTVGRGAQEQSPNRADPFFNLLAGLEVIDQRAKGRNFGFYEGLMTDERVLAALAERYGTAHVWSATELENYATCPHRFFLRNILAIQPLMELSLDSDYLERGSLLHAVLARAHANLAERASAAGAAISVDALRTALDDALQEILSPQPRHAPLAAALREIHRRALADWLSDYDQQLAAAEASSAGFEQPFRPAHFEAAFGQRTSAGESAPAPLDREQPVELEWRGKKLALAGRIDRIDVGRVGGQEVFRLIDYKSGSKREKPDEHAEPDGTRLQLELYALAVQQMLPGALPWDAGYWHVRLDGYRPWREFGELDQGRPQEARSWVEHRRRILAKVFSLVAGVRKGEFPMLSADLNCTSHCDYRTVCRVNHVRALEKSWTPPRGD